MTVYAVQRCVFDHLRRLEKVPAGQPRPELTVEGYDLTPHEREALIDNDVRDLYEMGVHPVLINGLCRSQGWKRADYRILFAHPDHPRGGSAGDAGTGRRPRWQTS